MGQLCAHGLELAIPMVNEALRAQDFLMVLANVPTLLFTMFWALLRSDYLSTGLMILKVLTVLVPSITQFSVLGGAEPVFIQQ